MYTLCTSLVLCRLKFTTSAKGMGGFFQQCTKGCTMVFAGNRNLLRSIFQATFTLFDNIQYVVVVHIWFRFPLVMLCLVILCMLFYLSSIYYFTIPTLYRMVEQELFPCLRHYGIRFYAYNPVSVLYIQSNECCSYAVLWVSRHYIHFRCIGIALGSSGLTISWPILSSDTDCIKVS